MGTCPQHPQGKWHLCMDLEWRDQNAKRWIDNVNFILAGLFLCCQQSTVSLKSSLNLVLFVFWTSEVSKKSQSVFCIKACVKKKRKKEEIYFEQELQQKRSITGNENRCPEPAWRRFKYIPTDLWSDPSRALSAEHPWISYSPFSWFTVFQKWVWTKHRGQITSLVYGLHWGLEDIFII